MLILPLLALYIHIPWCVRKCPYCDFNSHEEKTIPEKTYVAQLLADLEKDLPFVQGRKLHSIFFGGGTPSLFSVKSIGDILRGIKNRIDFEDDIEITLEANPGTAEAEKFAGFHAVGINRLSIGVQSFLPKHLDKLGRIHDSAQAKNAVVFAQDAGFERINIDLMHGLPDQNCTEAMADLQQAVSLGVTHISWYQLTIEPNTVFYQQRPPLPAEDDLWEIQQQGLAFLQENGFVQYEVSAFAKGNQRGRHNLNYWQFGDYLGIGAGAHGKITLPETQQIIRYSKTRLPRHYLERSDTFFAEKKCILNEALASEFLMNALRLKEGVDARLFAARTGFPVRSIDKQRQLLVQQGLLINDAQRLATTEHGFLFLNNVLAGFL